MIRIGLAGLGAHGSRYARHLLAGDVEGAVLTAVCRRDVDAGRRFAATHGLRFHPDPEALADDPEVDAVAVVLPPDRHERAATAALRQRKPVLVEKPMAADGDGARRLERLADDGGPLMVAHTLRFDAVVERVRAELPPLGAIDLIAINQHFEPQDRPWLDDAAPGGVLRNTAIHGLDLLRFLSGAEPVAVTAETARAVTRATEDVAVVVVRLEPGGILGEVRNARTTAGRSGRIEIVGRRGQIVGDHIHRSLERIVGRERRDLGPIPDRPTVPEVLRAFVKTIADGEPVPVTARDGRIAVEMVDAARESAASGRCIALV